jgi:hypothetical protein
VDTQMEHGPTPPARTQMWREQISLRGEQEEKAKAMHATYAMRQRQPWPGQSTHSRSWLTLLPQPLLVLLPGLLLPLLLALDALSYRVALPVEVTLQRGTATLTLDGPHGQTLTLGRISSLQALQFPYQDPALHEYQIDGSDSTNNFTLDLAYIHSIASSLYYRFQSWMRDLNGTSRWRNLQIWSGDHLLQTVPWPTDNSSLPLPATSSLRITLELQRPETPRSLILLGSDGSTLQITLDRNDRSISVTRWNTSSGSTPEQTTSTFFPRMAAPFAAEVLDTLLRSLLWATLALLAVLAAEGLLAGATAALQQRWSCQAPPLLATLRQARQAVKGLRSLSRRVIQSGARLTRPLTTALHPLALLALLGSLLYTLWIARVEYHGEPHIYDAAAYLFAAKTYALGQLSVPLPPVPDLFPGPFMVQFHGRWFAQYPPGTALTLVPGLWLGMPYAVEPLLGTAALLGIGLIAARLYNRQVATLAVILGSLSPFYSYLAASYLSHTVTLFYLVWGGWALLRFAQGRSSLNLLLAGLLFGMAYLTREEVAALYIVLLTLGTLLLYRQRLRQEWRRWLLVAPGFLLILLVALLLDLGFNAQLTGHPLTTPRSLFFAADHWGFGPGVGFYGEHTLAAGLVNLDEQLTILAIDLFGWPFYLTLAVPLLPFVTGKACGRDWLLLLGTACIAAAFVGYFYHGIYLGPRYLYETLPFLLMLTARGLLTLATSGATVRQWIAHWLAHGRQEGDATISAVQAGPQSAGGGRLLGSPATALLLALLLACNLLYYTPRQMALYHNYSALPAGTQLNLQMIYNAPLQNALVVTSDLQIYQLVLFPLNDPFLKGRIIYAETSDPSQYNRLRAAFPGRTLYELAIDPDGTVHYLPLP